MNANVEFELQTNEKELPQSLSQPEKHAEIQNCQKIPHSVVIQTRQTFSTPELPKPAFPPHRPVYKYSFFSHSREATHKLHHHNEEPNQDKKAASQNYKVIPVCSYDQVSAKERLRMKIEESQKRQLIKPFWPSPI